MTRSQPSAAEMWKIVDDNGDRNLFPAVAGTEPMAKRS